MTNYMVLDENLILAGILDEYESAIWTDRYNRYGDFEIYTVASTEILELMKPDRYIIRDDSEHVMVIEDIEIGTDVELGSTVTIRGRSLESILDRRIVWDQTTFNNKTLYNIILSLLDQNAISPKDTNRKIFRLYFDGGLGEDPVGTIPMYAQYTGDNLYDVIHDLCLSVNIGFKITINDVYKKFAFRLYNGVDRSYDQTARPMVEFSQNFGNLINSNYIYSKKTEKNVALVLGEGEGKNRKRQVVIPKGVSEKTNLERRELLVDARDISSDETSTSFYNAMLIQRGYERLAENSETRAFDGKAETSQRFRYNEHFKMGDICELENEYGITEKVRVTEYIYSESKSNGIENYPTFVVVGHEQDEGRLYKKLMGDQK